MCFDLHNEIDDTAMKRNKFSVCGGQRDVRISKSRTLWVCTNLVDKGFIFTGDVLEAIRHVNRNLETSNVARCAGCARTGDFRDVELDVFDRDEINRTSKQGSGCRNGGCVFTDV